MNRGLNNAETVTGTVQFRHFEMPKGSVQMCAQSRIHGLVAHQAERPAADRWLLLSGL
jgi:hypothetical protein